MALILKHQTPEAFINKLRAAYRDGDSAQVVKLARFIISRVQAGDITDAQCRAAFGRTSAQWTTLKNRMQSLINSDNAIKNATGE